MSVDYEPGQQVGNFTVIGSESVPVRRGKYQAHSAGYRVRCRCGHEIAVLRYELSQIEQGHPKARSFCSKQCPLYRKAVSERQKPRDDEPYEYGGSSYGLLSSEMYA